MSGSNTFDSTLDSSQNMLSKGPYLHGISVPPSLSQDCKAKLVSNCANSGRESRCIVSLNPDFEVKYFENSVTDFLLSNSQQTTSHLTTSDLWLASCRAVHKIFTIYCFHWTKVAMEAASAELLLIFFLFLCNDDEETEACSSALVTTSQSGHEISYFALSSVHLLRNKSLFLHWTNHTDQNNLQAIFLSQYILC